MSTRDVLGKLVRLDVPFGARKGQVVLGVPVSKLPSALIASVRGLKAEFLQLAEGLKDLTFLDFETRASAPLSAVGARRYIAHQDFEVICLAAILPGGRRLEWRPGDPLPEALFAAVRSGAKLVAHNAHAFDRLVWESLGWPKPVAWIDTADLARMRGLRGSLEALGKDALGIGKDVEGHRLMLVVNRIDSTTGRLPALSEGDRARLVEYCRRDVHLLRASYALELGGGHGDEEARAASLAVNERGFQFDVSLARSAIHLEHELVADAQRAAKVGGTILSSPAQLCGWLRHAGINVADARSATLSALLDEPDISDDVRVVVTARLMGAGITSKKLRAGLNRVAPDRRIRDSFVYFGARTGRWSGRGLQPQNLPRGVSLDEPTLGHLIDIVSAHDLGALKSFALEHGVDESELLSTLVRACIVAPAGKVLVAADYSQIEARVLLWLADDQDGLKPFRQGVDPYRAEVAPLFGVAVDQVDDRQRTLGKVMVLGAGFGVGAVRFEVYATSMGVDWAAAPLTPYQVIEAWRDRHPSIAGHRTGSIFRGNVVRRGGLWQTLELAAMAVVRTGSPQVAGRCLWSLERGHLVAELPSGRKLIYRQPSIGVGKFNKPQLAYLHGGQKVTTYGGKLAENITQAVSRDILAHALVALEGSGQSCVLHVHDEVVCECESPEAQAPIAALCKTAPSWAASLPIEVKTHAAHRYRK